MPSKYYYEKYKHSGICVNCGKVPPRKGSLSCKRCRSIRLKSSLKGYHKRKALGVCETCLLPVVPGKRRCADCLSKDLKKSTNAYYDTPDGCCRKCGGELEPGVDGKYVHKKGYCLKKKEDLIAYYTSEN